MGTTKKTPVGRTIGPDTVYAATYSGVPVYELICNKEIVMRRRGDDWLNATQFLKVANFDKPQRTRILEREVQKGVHEKIQGGYGKSQGTWVPFDRGVALAKQYNIEHLIRPLLEIDASHGSPPPAPKHVTAPPTKGKKKLAAEAAAAAAAAGGASSARSSPMPTGTGKQKGGLSKMATQAQAAQQQQQQQLQAQAQAAAAAQAQAHQHAQAQAQILAAQQAHAHAQAQAQAQAASSSAASTMIGGKKGGRGGLDREVTPVDQGSGELGGEEDASGEDESLSASPSEADSSSRTPSPIAGNVGLPHTQHLHHLGHGQMMMHPHHQQGYMNVNGGHHLGQTLAGPDGMELDMGMGMSGMSGSMVGQKRKVMEDGYPDDGPMAQRQRLDGMGMGEDQSMMDLSTAAGASGNVTGPPGGQGGMQMGLGMGMPVDSQMGYLSGVTGGGLMGPAQPGVAGSSIGAPDYGNIILDYFITEKARVPECLIDPPRDFDPNVPIDDDGHTALHWACAMGRLRVVKLLLTAGADIFRVNASEQTALMRSVMFSNNYDVRKFPELYQLLHRSTLNIDKSNRTVFHHIADVALSKGKTHAARYYMETILSHLEDFPRELEDVINFQDEDGETALTLAARARSKRLVKALLDHGADPKLANRDGKTAEDYILEDERFRSSPYLSLGGGKGTVGSGGLGDESQLPNQLPLPIPQAFAPQLYHSTAAQSAAGKVKLEVSGMLDSLAQGFDNELQKKEKEVVRSEGLLETLKSEIEESKRLVSDIELRTSTLEAEKLRLARLEHQLESNMGRRYRAGWESWVKKQKERLVTWEAAGKPEGEEYVDLKAIVDEQESVVEGQLKVEVEQAKQERLLMFKQFVTQQSEIGTGEKMSRYKKLIAAACGGMEPEQVDAFLTTVLETLEGETTTASTTAPAPPQGLQSSAMEL